MKDAGEKWRTNGISIQLRKGQGAKEREKTRLTLALTVGSVKRGPEPWPKQGMLSDGVAGWHGNPLALGVPTACPDED